MAKVLLVEDDKFFQKLYSSQLTKAGFEVIIAQDGEEALVKVQQENPQVIVLDLIMPKKDGFQVLKTLHAHPTFSKIPVIVFSTLSETDNITEAKKLGAIDFIDKSNVGVSDLPDKVKKYITKTSNA